MFPMSEILPSIRDLAVNELGDLGDSDTEQNAAIFRFVNVVMEKRVRQAYIEEFSDPLDITSDNDYTFLRNTAAIEDMYEPLGVYVTSKYGRTLAKRTSFEASVGWIREAANMGINIRGATGAHVLKYLRYPKQITASTDIIEFPRAAKTDLIMDVVSLVKMIKNFYNEAEAVAKLATGTATVKAAVAAKGSNSAPPSMLDKEL